MKRRMILALLFSFVFTLAMLPVRALADEVPYYRFDDEEAPLAAVAEEEPVEAGNVVTDIEITNLNTNFIPRVQPWWGTKLTSSDTSGRSVQLIWENWQGEYSSFHSTDRYYGTEASGAPNEGVTYEYTFVLRVDEPYTVPFDTTVTINGKKCSAVARGPMNTGEFRYYYFFVDYRVKASQPVPLYRMYNTKTSEHLWTRNKKEYDSAGTGNYADWKAEGVAWYVPKQSAKPVYRLYNTKSGDHHYTTSAAERDKLVGSGQWRDEGIAFYSATAKDKESIRIYRVYNSRLKRGQHHYTKSAAERDSLVKNSGWKDEGVGFYGYGKATVTPDPEYAQH